MSHTAMEVGFDYLALVHALTLSISVDITSSETSTFPYDSEKLLHIARVIDKVRGNITLQLHLVRGNLTVQ